MCYSVAGRHCDSSIGFVVCYPAAFVGILRAIHYLPQATFRWRHWISSIASWTSLVQYNHDVRIVAKIDIAFVSIVCTSSFIVYVYTPFTGADLLISIVSRWLLLYPGTFVKVYVPSINSTKQPVPAAALISSSFLPEHFCSTIDVYCRKVRYRIRIIVCTAPVSFSIVIYSVHRSRHCWYRVSVLVVGTPQRVEGIRAIQIISKHCSVAECLVDRFLTCCSFQWMSGIVRKDSNSHFRYLSSDTAPFSSVMCITPFRSRHCWYRCIRFICCWYPGSIFVKDITLPSKLLYQAPVPLQLNLAIASGTFVAVNNDVVLS